MNQIMRRAIRRLATAIFVAGLMFVGLSEGRAQAKTEASAKQFAGTWILVSLDDERPDGTKIPLYGPNPDGMLMFDTKGRYSIQVCAASRPKFSANDRRKGTPEEYQAAVVGCNPHWGTYSINQVDKTIVLKIEHALYTNWEGTEQKRSFTLTGDELKYNVPNPPTAAANIVAVWKRAQ